ncbi:hypothetical protein BJP39_09955 [Streptomyces sp. CC77]|nr:hypothetical protein BJP39_09955 [Streptomyces sp. CC77]
MPTHRLAVRNCLDGPTLGPADLTMVFLMRENEDGEKNGRGLVLVDRLAHRWGTNRRGWGRVVWAELEMPTC